MSKRREKAIYRRGNINNYHVHEDIHKLISKRRNVI